MSDALPANRTRWSGLDGLRALAVLAVLGFHFAPGVVPGGFLGVDLFFALSGYLITRMITAEYLQRGRFRVGNFYLRRARRLLPGVAVLLVAVLAASAFWRDQLSTVRAATLAAAGYVSNWWLSFAHQSYFVSAGRPSMLQHLWSLGVEEQFYLLWPVCALGVLALAGRRRRPAVRVRWLAVVAVLLALGSTAEMWALANAQHAPYDTDASRLYYGTDTHSMGLLLGAALGALAAARPRPHPRETYRWVWLSDLAALGALVALAVIVFTTSESAPGLYRGGFFLVAVLAATATAAVARRHSAVGWLLDRRPLRWLAARSYAIYLWHWPVAVVTRPGADVHWPAPVVLLVRVAVTIALSDLTHRFVELPVRTLGARGATRRLRERLSGAVAGRAPVATRLVSAVAVTAVLVAGGVFVLGPKPALSATQRSLADDHGGQALPIGPPAQAATPNRRVVADGLDLPPPAVAAPVTTVVRSPTPTPAPVTGSPLAARLPAISAFGDSVLLGARGALDARFPGGTMDAIEGRQADPILQDVQRDARAGKLSPLVVIDVGDNGLISPDVLRSTLQRLGDHQVIVVNLRVDRPWQDPNNRTIAKVVPRFGNAAILDWHRESAGHPSWFYDDGIHLTPDGADGYAGLIAALARARNASSLSASRSR
ncbi:MAG TPA: acyltransferase family protein [Jatrophihabitans sp.]|nr:acyltransferase family protein [Jatrophihabitans sp.]